jgi:NitT/TauT family transport system permease protein
MPLPGVATLSARRPAARRRRPRLTRWQTVGLGAVPFAALAAVYATASHFRRAANPNDRLLPSLGDMAQTFWAMATVPEQRSGDLLLWTDTFLSLSRLAGGMLITTAIAVVLGVAIGYLPQARATLAPFVAAISLIPPITVLPILFIVFGLGEASKIMLIVVGAAPVMTRTLSQAVMDIPAEQLIKARTLGASGAQIVVRVILPQLWPKLFTAVRLALVPAWIFLVSAEAIASTGGLGYRIFLVRRYLAMDIILPYVAWITLLAYLIDRTLSFIAQRRFAWAYLEGESL